MSLGSGASGRPIQFLGLVLTGWSRYDHFAVLCELLGVRKGGKVRRGGRQGKTTAAPGDWAMHVAWEDSPATRLSPTRVEDQEAEELELEVVVGWAVFARSCRAHPARTAQWHAQLLYLIA